MIVCSYAFLAQRPQPRRHVVRSASYRGGHDVACLITGDADLDHLVEAMSARFVHCKITTDSFLFPYPIH